jgi:transcriptional regulator with XRE-family HTH domain
MKKTIGTEVSFPMTTMHYVALLKKMRKENGLTQQQVADFLHLDRSTYAYYESGRTKINIDILIRLSKFFQVSLGDLVGENLPPTQNLADPTVSADAVLIDESVSKFAQLSREEQYLVILFRSGSPGQRQKILEQALLLTEPEKKANA